MTDDVVKEAQEAFALCADRESENRRSYEADVDFALLENQWPAALKAKREADDRPCLVENRLAAFIHQVVNDARQNTPSISVHPVDDGADRETAEILNGLIRNIEQTSRADGAYDTALECAVSGGFGYFRINTDYACDDSFDQELVIKSVPDPLSVYGDPYSFELDSSDWNTAFVTEQMTKAAFKKKYKGAQAVDWAAAGYDEAPAPWCEGDQVMVAEYWSREAVTRQIAALDIAGLEAPTPEQAAAWVGLNIPESGMVDLTLFEENKALFDSLGVGLVGRPRPLMKHKVTQRVVSGAEVLETIDWAGKYIPIVPVFGKVVVLKGKRRLRSLVRSALDAQRRHNYHLSSMTELTALAPRTPFIGPVGAFETDRDKWETANTENHAFIEYDTPEGGGGIPPQRQPYAGVPIGEMQLALAAADGIKATVGMFDASLGARSNEVSGRAILARQREGDTASFHFIDNLQRAISHGGRILIDLIPKVYSTPRILRVLGPEGRETMTPVNQPFEKPEAGPDGMVRSVRKIYDLSIGRYDLTVRSGPSFASRREEAASQMIELIRAFPMAAPVIGDLLVKNLDWPGADEIAQRMKTLVPPQAQGGAPGMPGAPGPQGPNPAAMIQAVTAQYGQALQQLKARYDALAADKAVEARKLDIEMFKAETARVLANAKLAGMGAGAAPAAEA